jgi:HSP20 family protein
VLSSRWSDATFVPEVEMFEKDGHLVVRVDLPGLRKEDVTVHATDDELTIQGERRQEREEQGRNFYRTERSYGAFRRTIPLPEGVKSETVHATFRQGVLEVTMDAPAPRAPRGRTVRIWTEPDAATSKSA